MAQASLTSVLYRPWRVTDLIMRIAPLYYERYGKEFDCERIEMSSRTFVVVCGDGDTETLIDVGLHGLLAIYDSVEGSVHALFIADKELPPDVVQKIVDEIMNRPEGRGWLPLYAVLREVIPKYTYVKEVDVYP